MIIAVASSCPGAGTTTLAVNLAVAYSRSERKVLLVDGNGEERESATHFTARRVAQNPALPQYSAVSYSGEQITETAPQFHSMAEEVLIDTCGQTLRPALSVADIVIIPVLPGFIDSMLETVEAVTDMRRVNPWLRALVVFNRTTEDTLADSKSAAKAVLRNSRDIEIASHGISKDGIFTTATVSGLSVLEQDAPGAIRDLNHLLELIARKQQEPTVVSPTIH